MTIAHSCAHCLAKVKSKKREFTDQAWTVLFAWGEVAEQAVDAPVCDDCYIELRDILIDRAVEVETALKNPDALKKMVEAAKNPKPTPTIKKQAAVSKVPPKSMPTVVAQKSNVVSVKSSGGKSNSRSASAKTAHKSKTAATKSTQSKGKSTAASKKAKKPSRLAS